MALLFFLFFFSFSFGHNSPWTLILSPLVYFFIFLYILSKKKKKYVRVSLSCCSSIRTRRRNEHGRGLWASACQGSACHVIARITCSIAPAQRRASCCNTEARRGVQRLFFNLALKNANRGCAAFEFSLFFFFFALSGRNWFEPVYFHLFISSPSASVTLNHPDSAKL